MCFERTCPIYLQLSLGSLSMYCNYTCSSRVEQKECNVKMNALVVLSVCICTHSYIYMNHHIYSFIMHSGTFLSACLHAHRNSFHDAMCVQAAL